jgi:putative SOS response-associated peptidase YedK
MKPVHERMPVILEEDEWAAWLDSSNRDATRLLDPADNNVLDLWPVSTMVNNPRNDDPHCIERVAESAW